MFKKIIYLSLIPCTFIGFCDASTLAAIPQAGIQEIFIEGYENQVNQKINQEIALGLVYLPSTVDYPLPKITIQDIFIENDNNEVNQRLNQSFFGLPSDENNDNNFDFDNFNFNQFNTDDFLNNDLFLDAIQITIQEVEIEGNNNTVTQNSYQNIVDFNLFGELTNDINNLIESILNDTTLDTLQFTLQDTLISGDNNFVDQEINQKITNFLFIEEESSWDLENILVENKYQNKDNFISFDNDASEDIIGDPARFTIQETFVDLGENNLINQELNQTITDVFVIDYQLIMDEYNQYSLLSYNAALDNDDDDTGLDIGEFLDTILFEVTLNTRQKSEQFSFLKGNDNRDNQQNKQNMDVTVPEPNSTLALFLLGIVAIAYKKQLDEN